MKFFKTIILILISFCIFNLANAKDFVKVYKQDEISKYFSGVISLNDNEYGNSYIYLKKLDGFETSHFNFSQLFQYTLINLGKFDEAYIYSKKLERKKIQTFESNLIIGVFYLKRGDYKNAAKYFKKLEDKNQTFLLQSLLSESLNAWILFPKLTQNEAREKIKNISNTFENVKKIQETFSYCFYNNNKTDIQFEKLISDSKIDFTRYSFFYANFLFKKGKTDKANKIIDSSLKKFPRNLILGQMKDDMESKKIKHFSNKFDCENLSNIIAELFYIISNVTSTQNMYSISNFYLSLAKFLNPNFISFDTLLAENYYMIDKYDESIQVYKRIRNKGNIYNWYASKQIASILVEQKKNPQGLNFLKKSFNNFSNPSVYQIYDYAEFLKRNDKFAESIVLFSKVLNEVSEDHKLFSKSSDGRGISYERIGEWEKAEKDFLNSLRKSPDQAYVLNYLAYSWIEKGINIEKSLSMLKKANDLKKNNGYITDSLGWALFKLKRYNEAEKYLRKAIKLMPADPIINDHYGDSLWMKNQTLQARYYWKTAFELEGAEEDLKKKIEEKLLMGLEE